MDNIVSKRCAFRPSTGHLNIKQKEPARAAASSCAYGKIHNFLRLLAVRFSTSCGQIFNFLRLLAVRLSASCVSNFLAGSPQKLDIFTSCGSLRVLAAQEVLPPLLARALFWGCTVLYILI